MSRCADRSTSADSPSVSIQFARLQAIHRYAESKLRPSQTLTDSRRAA
jgi:hypothetical protein